MRRSTQRCLSALLSVLMLLSLFIPTGAVTMTGEERLEIDPVLEEVGTMPDLQMDDMTEPEEAGVEEDPAGEDPQPILPETGAELSATSNAHLWTPDDPSDTFFTVACTLQGPGTADANVQHPVTGFKWTKADGTQQTLTTVKSAKLESGKSVSFTVPAGQAGTFYIIQTPRNGGTNFTLDGKSVSISSNTSLYTTRLEAGSHTVTVGKKQADIHMLLWEPDCEHTWDSGTVTKDATCTAEGVKTFTCTKCGGTKTETIAMTAHTEKTIPQKAPTCKDQGKTAEVVCADCGKHISGGEAIPVSKDHVLNATFQCTVCGKQLADPSHTCDFDKSKGVEVKKATCTEDGAKEYPCKTANCDKTKVETVTKLGHDIAQHAAQAATCETAGWEAYEACKRAGCDYTTKKTIPAKGHQTGADGNCTVCGQLVSKPLTNAGGWFETLYAVLPGMTDADVTGVSYSGAMSGKLTGDDLEYLVRDTADGVRVDIPGLTPGAYTLRVTAKGVNYEAKDLEVMEYDRSGYAHFNYTQGVGAYRDDGILKENAIVLYVTEETKNTVTLEAPDGTTVTGIGNILNTNGQDVGTGANGKGGLPNSNKGILKKLADANIPLVVRIVGDVKSSHPDPTIDGLSAYDSVDYGGSVGDNGNMARMKACKDITIEGIGPDACVNGWGFHFICGSDDPAAGRGKSFEVRNVAFRNVPEDCIGMEGQQSGSTLTAPVERGWVHNCSFYAPSINPAAESDKKGGDGACDFKRGNYFTMDYCYYEGYHKTNLVGSSDSSLQYHITWHHNHWKNCESRGPLGRQANMHIYNCIYEGQSSYAMNPRANCYIFSEYNLFDKAKNPVTVKAGAVKSYKDVFAGTSNDNDATIVTDKTQVVDSANLYKSFELSDTLSYIPSGDYKLDQSIALSRQNITAYAGPMKAQIIKAEDVSIEVVDKARVPAGAVALPYDQDLNKAYIASSGEKDNIRFDISGSDGGFLKIGRTEIGQDIIFKVDQSVDIAITDGGGTGTASLGNAGGEILLVGTGEVKNLPAGVYFIQSSMTQPGKNGAAATFKEAKVAHLTIKATTATEPPHVHSYTGWKQTVEPTCTKVGTEVGACSCGETSRRDVAKLDHNYVGGACSMCGVLEGTFTGGNDDPSQPQVPVEGLDLSTGAVYLLEGKSERVVATVSPANATNKRVTWTSSDTSVATVAANGTITGKGPGAAVVTAEIAGFTQTVDVTVIAVSTETYTFAATEHGPKTVADKTKGEDPVADGSKWGTKNYFRNHGANNKWKAKDYSKGNMATTALMLAAAADSSLDFTVPEGATATLTLNFTSTSSANTSAIGLLDATGALVDGKITTVTGTGTQSATYELGEGTYQIVSPANILPSDVNETWDVFPSGADDPNTRGARLIRAVVVEETIASGDIVAVNGVSLNKTSASLEVGQTGTLLATVEPANATNKNVSWTTSDAAVATVSKGTVTAWGVGTATITATCGGKSATCTVTVTPSTHVNVLVTSITITDAEGKSDGAVTADANHAVELQLFRLALPEEADNKSVTWSSDKESQGVSVNQNGLVTVAETAPTCVATITAEAQDGSGVKDTYTLSVTAAPNADPGDEPSTPPSDQPSTPPSDQPTTPPSDQPTTPPSETVAVTGVALDRKSASIKAGSGMTLKATVSPANATNKSVYWTSSDTTVATVDQSGRVTGVQAGLATIVVTTLDGDWMATCTVSVTSGGYVPSGGGGGGGGSSSAKPATPSTTPSGKPEATLPFLDVAVTTWFHDSVKRAYDLGLMKGTDATHFAPNATTTRSMVATVLYRLDGEKKTDVKELFEDVASGQWYSEAVAWASAKGVVKGYDADTFAPDDNVTREQLAVMLYRYANAAKPTKDLKAFNDAASVSDWALEAVTWAVEKGIITGKGNETLDPQGLATRAEICTMLVRFLDLKK